LCTLLETRYGCETKSPTEVSHKPTDDNSDEESEGSEVATQKLPEFCDVSEKVGMSLVQSGFPNRHRSSNVPLIKILSKQALDVSYYTANNLVDR
jgi:hypothetical protein